VWGEFGFDGEVGIIDMLHNNLILNDKALKSIFKKVNYFLKDKSSYRASYRLIIIEY